MRQRARAPRVAKLTKPRPLRHRLPSIETGPPTTEPGQTTERVKDRLPSIETGPPPAEPAQTTEQGFTPEFFSVKSEDEAEGNGVEFSYK